MGTGSALVWIRGERVWEGSTDSALLLVHPWGGLFHLDQLQFPSPSRGTLIDCPWRVTLRGNAPGYMFRDGQGQFLL